jgi:hypothetical protein
MNSDRTSDQTVSPNPTQRVRSWWSFSLQQMLLAFFVLASILMFIREVQEYLRERGGRDPIPLVVSDPFKIYVRQIPYRLGDHFQYEIFLPAEHSYEFCAAHFSLEASDELHKEFRNFRPDQSTLTKMPEPEFVYPHRQRAHEAYKSLRIVAMSTEKISNASKPNHWCMKFGQVMSHGITYMSSLEYTIQPEKDLSASGEIARTPGWNGTEEFGTDENIILYMKRTLGDHGRAESPVSGFVVWLRKAPE